MAGYRGARFDRRVQWMWMFAFLAYCYSVGSVVLPETPDANEAVRGEDADALEASQLASMPADIRAKINKINDETAKELDADGNWPFEDDFPSGQSMTNHETASFLQLDSTDDASTKLNEDPNALKTGLNEPIDIQTKIADEGSSFIQEEASTDSTKTKFNEVGSLPGYFCVAEAEAEALPDHDCVISPEHAKIQQDCNQIAKERDTVCGFKIDLAGSCKAATNFYHKTCKQNPARKVHHWQGGMGLGKQTNSQALLQESTGDDQALELGGSAAAKHGTASSWTQMIDNKAAPLLVNSGCANTLKSSSACNVDIFHNVLPTKTACKVTSSPRANGALSLGMFMSYSKSSEQSAGCNMRCYRGRYADLRYNADGSQTSDELLLNHYNTHGQGEGRNCKCDVLTLVPVALSSAQLSSIWSDDTLQNSGNERVTVEGEEVLNCSWATYQKKTQKMMIMAGRGHFLADMVGDGSSPQQCIVNGDYTNNPASYMGTSCRLKYDSLTGEFTDPGGAQEVDSATYRLATCVCEKYAECFPKNITGTETYSASSAAIVTNTWVSETSYVKNSLGFYEYVAQPDEMVCRNSKRVRCSPDTEGVVFSKPQESILQGMQKLFTMGC